MKMKTVAKLKESLQRIDLSGKIPTVISPSSSSLLNITHLLPMSQEAAVAKGRDKLEEATEASGLFWF